MCVCLYAGAALLSELSTQLFQTEAFRKLLRIVCGYRVAQRHCTVRRFRPGLDFSVAHHGQLSEKWWLSTSLCIVDDDAAEDARAWQSEEVGCTVALWKPSCLRFASELGTTLQ